MKSSCRTWSDPEPLLLRPAGRSDSGLLLEWRNHPTVRRASFQQEPIDATTHRRWLAGVLADARRRLYIAMWQGEPVGMLRLDLDGRDGAELSLLVDPGHRGRGMGRRLLGRAMDLARRLGLRRLHARVRPDNRVSRHLFSSCGWRQAAAVPGEAVHFSRSTGSD